MITGLGKSSHENLVQDAQDDVRETVALVRANYCAGKSPSADSALSVGLVETLLHLVEALISGPPAPAARHRASGEASYVTAWTDPGDH